MRMFLLDCLQELELQLVPKTHVVHRAEGTARIDQLAFQA
jgi:hypothetical protein